LLKTAVSLALIRLSSDSCITLLTPLLAEGISDDEVVEGVFFAITDDGDGMVRFGATVCSVNDTFGVVFENMRAGINSSKNYTNI
jgi:hypothetical protein